MQRVQRPGVSWHGLPWYLPALVLARSVLLPVLCSRSGCAGGWGLHPRGIQGAPGVGQVMPAIKFFKEKGVFWIPLANTTPSSQNETSVIVQYSKFSEKYKKTPLPV